MLEHKGKKWYSFAAKDETTTGPNLNLIKCNPLTI